MTAEDIERSKAAAEKTVEAAVPPLVALFKLVVLPLLIVFLLAKMFCKKEPQSRSWW